MSAPGGPGGPPDLARLARELSDRVAIHDLITRYFLALDRGTYDEKWAADVFTGDVILSFPPGDHQGTTGVVEFTRSFMSRWARTHHHTADFIVDIADDHATVAFNVIATHISHGSPSPPESGTHFHLGCRFGGEAERTERGWRLRQLGLTVIWSTGAAAPGIPAAAGRGQEHHLTSGKDIR